MADEGRNVLKAWGREVWLTNTDKYCAKQLYIQPDFVCSFHAHNVKDETFICSEGQGWLELGDEIYRLLPGHVYHVPVGTYHRFWSDGGTMVLLEISTHHNDLDVVRKIDSRPILSGIPLNCVERQPGPDET